MAAGQPTNVADAFASRYEATPAERRPKLGPCPEVWIVGHRGSPQAAVENTLPSFSRAIREGANALELDLSLTQDGAIVLWHDDDPDEYRSRFRQWGLEPFVGFRPHAPWQRRLRRPTRELELRVLREHYGYREKHPGGRRVDAFIPTLADFFEWAARESGLGLVFLDLKITRQRVHDVAAVLTEIDRLTAELRPEFRVIVESSTPAVIDEIRARAPHHEAVLDVEPHAGVVFDLERCSAVRAAVHHGLRHAVAQKPRSITLWPFSTHKRIVARDLAALRRHNEAHPDRPIEGLGAFLINDAEQMSALLDLGVWAIQTDRPALLRRILARRQLEAETNGAARAGMLP